MCPSVFLRIFRDKIGGISRLTFSLNLRFQLRLGGYIPYGMRFSQIAFPYGSSRRRHQDITSTIEDLREKNSGTLGNYSRRLQDYSGSAGVPSSFVVTQVLLKTFACSARGRLRTTRGAFNDYSRTSHSTTKYSGACRMDIPGPTTKVDHARIQDGLPGQLQHVGHGARRRGPQGNSGLVLE